MSRLTTKQRRLVNEMNRISQLLHIDFWNAETVDPNGRTAWLEMVKRQMVLAEVVRAYTVIDEYLNVAMCHYYFGKRKSFIRLWKTKRFKIFNYHIIEEMYPIQKLRLVKAIRPIPGAISQDIERLNALRNGLAHAFFPENLSKTRPEWKGKGIFTLDGMTRFRDDMRVIYEYFWKLEMAGTANE